VELDEGRVIGRHTLSMNRRYPHEVPDILRRQGVELVITGGMNHFLQNLFRSRGIELIWGIIGEVDEVLAAYVSGQLTPGMGCCPRRHRRRRFRGRH